MLSANQIRQYHEAGYLVLEDAIAPVEIEALKNAALRIVDGFDISRNRAVFTTSDRDRGRDDYFFDSAQNINCFLEEGAVGPAGELLKPARLAINKIGHAMHDLNPAFGAFCRQAVFGRVLRDIGYHNPLLWQTMYIFKQPHIGGEVRWHQDGSYLITEPKTVTGIWVAVEDANRDNGCLWVQPGGHLSSLRETYQVDWQTRKGEITPLDRTPWPSIEEAVALEVRAGSLVIFHDHMPHCSSQNRSERSRHAFTLHVAESSSAWSGKNWLQRTALGDFRL
ncbi:MAG: phytanoyl-CoA dioxygenase family protein [Lysobacterales bacterium]